MKLENWWKISLISFALLITVSILAYFGLVLTTLNRIFAIFVAEKLVSITVGKNLEPIIIFIGIIILLGLFKKYNYWNFAGILLATFYFVVFAYRFYWDWDWLKLLGSPDPVVLNIILFVVMPELVILITAALLIISLYKSHNIFLNNSHSIMNWAIIMPFVFLILFTSFPVFAMVPEILIPTLVVSGLIIWRLKIKPNSQNKP